MKIGDSVLVLETSERGVVVDIEDDGFFVPVLHVDCTEAHDIGPVEPVVLNRKDLEYADA